MMELPFGTDAIDILINFRSASIDKFFQCVSYMGEVEGYILMITFIYMLLDKKLAFRLSILALISMSLNHLLKSIIAMQRPFVKEGTYLNKWLVSTENANELVTEYSTPSGHAMSSSTFYGYIWTIAKSRIAKYTMILLILLVGLSRPYLAVHFVEDILLGWVFGAIIIIGVLRYSEEISKKWNSMNLGNQVGIVLIWSLFIWITTFFINGGNITSQPLPFVGYLGFLLGVCVGYNLEEKHIRFDPKSKSLLAKIMRWMITIILVMIPVIILDEVFESMWSEPTYFSHLLQYIGYTIAGFLGIFIAPWIFVKLNLLDRVAE